MDREGFRNRMKQYKEAKGFDPLLKYWEWKQKYDSSPLPDNMPALPVADTESTGSLQLESRAHRWDNGYVNTNREPFDSPYDDGRFYDYRKPRFELRKGDVHYGNPSLLKWMGKFGKVIRGGSIVGEAVQNLFPSEEAELIEDLRVKINKQNKQLLGQEDIPKYDEGTGGVRDNTYVAPIEKELIFIPATGATKFLQEYRKRTPRGGNLEIVSPEFDILTGIRAIATLPTKAEKLGREILRSDFISDDEITNLINSKRIADLTIFGKNSNKYVHTDLGKSNSVFAGKNKGAYVQDKHLYPGEARIVDQKPYVWWNKGKRYTPLGENEDGYQAIVIGDKNAKDLLQVRQSSEPIGQWNGKTGFVLPSEYVTNHAVNLTPDVEHYVYDGLTKTYNNVKHYADGGEVGENEYSPVWPRTSKTERQIYFDRINPAAGFGFGDFVAQGMNYYFPEGERQKAPKEDEARWAAYLGLPYDKTYAPDTKIRFDHDKDYPNRQYQGLSKDAKNEIREEIIPMLQRNYSKLGEKWIQITDEKPTDIIRNDEMYYPRLDHIGDLGKFGIREVNNSGIYEVGDKYDFPWYVPVPDRADGYELMIRDTIWSDKAKPELYIKAKEKIKKKK